MSDFTDKTDLLRFILDERRRELIMSGIRLFDIKRLNLEPEFTKSVTHYVEDTEFTLEPESPNLVFPIPGVVLNYNPDMEQNPRN